MNMRPNFRIKRRASRSRFLALILLLVQSVALLHPAPRVQAQGTCTYTVTGDPANVIVMGDAAAALNFVVTNTSTVCGAGPLKRIKFEVAADVYNIGTPTIGPAGWKVLEFKNAGGGQAYVIFVADPSPGLAPGESLTFTIHVRGPFKQANADVPDALSVTATDYTLTGSAPTWPRKGLALSVSAAPSSVGVGKQFTVVLMVTNRSNTTQNNIAPTLTVSPAGLATRISGPSPSTLSLASGASGIMTYVYRAEAEGIVGFTGSAANSAVSSKSIVSNAVVIGDFTAQLEITPVQIVSGQQVTVRMRVANNGAVALGQVTPSALTLVGGVTVSAFSGPSPKKVASLAPGSATTFEWTYTLNGATGNTFAFEGRATADGPVTTNAARSNTGILARYAAFVTPAAVGAGTTPTPPLRFTVSNSGGVNLNRIYFQLPTGFTFSSGTGIIVGKAGCSWSFGSSQFSVSGCFLESGETAILTATSTIPTPVVDTSYDFILNLCSGSDCIKSGGNENPGANWEGAAVVLLTVTRYRITVTAQPATLPADGASTSVIRATVLAGSTPVPNAQVTFATLGAQGTLSAYGGVTNASGVITVTFTAPVSTVNLQTTIIAEHFAAQGQVTLNLIGNADPNPLYVGGTLAPSHARPGDTVALTLNVINQSAQAFTLTTASQISFSDGIRTYSAPLAAGLVLPADALRTLNFAAAAVPVGFTSGAYYPTLSLTGWTTTPASPRTFVRPVSDPFLVGGAALVATLSAGPLYPAVGQTIAVTMTVTNVGFSAASNVRPTPLPLTLLGAGGVTLVSGPTPASVATLAANASATFTWRYTAATPGALQWRGKADGVDVLTNAGLTTGWITSNGVTIIFPAALSAAFQMPATVNVGQSFSVILAATNPSLGVVQNLAPGPLTLSSARATYTSGPVPASVAQLNSGATTNFVWTYTATSAGVVNWSGSVTGMEAGSGRTLTAAATSTNVTIQQPAALGCALGATPTVVNAGDFVTVVMTATNTGGATAQNVAPAALSMAGSGAATWVSGPAGAPANIPGGGSAQFTWTYQAAAPGTVTWTGNASGTDANDGKTVSTPNCTSNLVTVKAAAALVSSLSVAPEVVGQNELVLVTMRATNLGGNPASNVSPSALTLSDALLFSLVSGPAPASGTLAAGESISFTWSYRAAAARTGVNTWSGNASGKDSVTNASINSLITTSNPATVYVIVPDKTVQSAFTGYASPGEALIYTIALRNTGSAASSIASIADTLPAGFRYGETLASSCTVSSAPTAGQTGALTWTTTACSLSGGSTVTLRFTAVAPAAPGRYCNAIGYTPTSGSPVTRAGLACVTIAWPEYEIVSRVGALRIVTRVRLVNGNPIILSWEIRP